MSMVSSDKIQNTYPGKVDEKNGYLVLTKNKLMFLKEEGFLSKKYSVTVNLPYEKVRDYSYVQNLNLEIVDTLGNKKVFVSEVAASSIVDTLRTLITNWNAAISA